MTSLEVWNTPDPFPPGLKKSSQENNGHACAEQSGAVQMQEGLAVTESGRSVKVQTDRPHLVSLGGGRLSTAVTIHPLSEGRTYIGRGDSPHTQDIIIEGTGVEKEHCYIENEHGVVVVHPLDGAVSLDGMRIMEPTRLSQGCMVCLGRSNFFRFNHPQEAQLIKQVLPNARISVIPTGFLPVVDYKSPPHMSAEAKTSKSHRRHHHHHHHHHHHQNASDGQYYDSVDFVEKVSKFEYLAHSQSPPVTSQDSHKWFVKEGIRIPSSNLHSSQSGRNSVGHSPVPGDASSKSLSPASRMNPGFFPPSKFTTPPPSPLHISHSSRASASPRSPRMYSKTPDPITAARSSGGFLSGRCTPTSPQLTGHSSHHVSVEDLKACEEELHEQHRKAIAERLKDQEQERQERQRLEEILNLCAEYERQAQKEKQMKNTKEDGHSLPHPNSSSSGEFSTASSESSAPSSWNSSDTSEETSSNKPESNTDALPIDEDKTKTPDSVSSDKVVQYGAVPPSSSGPLSHSPNQPKGVSGNIKRGSSPPYIHVGTYHTLPNRIKTNGSLPRDRNNYVIASTADVQRYGTLPSEAISTSDNATLIVNHKALNSASSEDELVAILGSGSAKTSPTSAVPSEDTVIEDHRPSSPYMGTAFLTYPHSPRTRIRTVAVCDRGPEVYENRLAWSEFAKKRESPHQPLTSPLSVGQRLSPSVSPKYHALPDSGSAFRMPSNLQGMDVKKNVEVNCNSDEFHGLKRTKQECVQSISMLQKNISDLENQRDELLNELELEHALVNGEKMEELEQCSSEQERLKQMEEREQVLIEQSEIAKQEEHVQLEAAKAHLQEKEQIVKEIHKQYQDQIKKQDESEQSKQNDENLKKAITELKDKHRHACEVLETERKKFEDLEFQHLEVQTHREEERELIQHEIEQLRKRIEERQTRMRELTQQQQSLSEQMKLERNNFEQKIQKITKQLHKETTDMETVDGRIGELSELVRGQTPANSRDSSPQSSDAEILSLCEQLKKNLKWNQQADGSLISSYGPPADQRMNRNWTNDNNCNSFHSLESESSSVTSSDVPVESASSGADDPSRPASFHKAEEPTTPVHVPIEPDSGGGDNGGDQQTWLEPSKNHLCFQDETPLMGVHNDRTSVKRREKLKAQRPLTRYLPVRSAEFDLRQHIESAGHQIELVNQVVVTPTSCHGYLHKLGGRWRIWKKRWFVFDRQKRVLLYYTDKSETKLKGSVYFQFIEEVYVDHQHSVKSPNPQATFCVKTFDRVYHLIAPNPESMRIWVDVIFTGAEGYLDFLTETDS